MNFSNFMSMHCSLYRFALRLVHVLNVSFREALRSLNMATEQAESSTLPVRDSKRGKPGTAQPVSTEPSKAESSPGGKTKNTAFCRVQLLDGTDYEIRVDVSGIVIVK